MSAFWRITVGQDFRPRLRLGYHSTRGKNREIAHGSRSDGIVEEGNENEIKGLTENVK